MRFLGLLCIFSPLIFFSTEGYRILAVFPVPMYSHYTFVSAIYKELARTGHQVTAVTPFLQNNPVENLEEISLASIIPAFKERQKHLLELEGDIVFHNVNFLTSMGLKITEEALKNENFQSLLRSKREFDVILLPEYLNDALLAIPERFPAPVVLVATMPLFAWSSFQLGHPTTPADTPNLLCTFTGYMNFWQRMANVIFDVYSILYHQMVVLPKHSELARKYIPGSPDLSKNLNNECIILINSHLSVYNAVPTTPNTIQVGGLHIAKNKALPLELKDLLDNSREGVILFSMGSNIKSADFPIFQRKEILKTFSSINQTVLWKFESDDIGVELPDNVKLMKWLPQQDVLAHPNTRVFISHGGLMSTIESVYFGVPLVGIPIFADQKVNMATAVSFGYATLVPFHELTQEKLSFALGQVLHNIRYKENALIRSRIMHDQPMKPLDAAIFWIEYVVRHKGAPHLKHLGVKLRWYQRYLFDVLGFCIMMLVAIFLLCWVLFKATCRICSSKRYTCTTKLKTK